MDTLITKQMEMLIRVHENWPEFALAAPEGSHGAELFTDLTQVNEDLRGAAYNQSRWQSAVRESSGNAAATRDELVRRLDAVYQAARVMAPANPGLEDKFRSPRGVPDQALITLTATYTNDAFPLKASFIKLGLGADFVAELDAASVAFDTALNARTQALGKQVAATAELDRLIKRGLQIVREMRVLVRNVYANDPSKLALWESASHVERISHKPRNKDNGDGGQTGDGNAPGGGNQPPPPSQT